ncbi:hypothetical protein AB395_00005186 (plasmid) [Sinorhizobium fredii CCBAU 45436]|nr:hypothetical protein AB395_00005186 [Sinorhizobium fredii CCBAU 45436]
MDTKAAKDPESFYVLIKRHRDAKKADALSHSRKEEESFDKRVKDALG